jgi:hypothetical protein
MLIGGMPFSLSLPISQCVVPAGINGPVAIWITSDDQPLNGGAVDRQSNAIVAGPLMTFINAQPDGLGSLVRNNGQSGASGSGSGAGSSTTVTVNPSQASSILASISAIGSAPTSSADASASASVTMDMSMPSVTASQANNGPVFSMIPMPTMST